MKVDSPNRIIMDDKFWAKVTEIETKLGNFEGIKCLSIVPGNVPSIFNVAKLL